MRGGSSDVWVERYGIIAGFGARAGHQDGGGVECPSNPASSILQSSLRLNDTRRTTDSFLNHPTGNLRDSQTQAYGLAELFASDPIAKRLVLQLPLHTYVSAEALSLWWGSDKRLMSKWLRADSDAVRRLGVHTKQFYENKTRTKAIALGSPNSDPPESRRVGGVAAPAPLHAVLCVGPTAAGTKRVEAWSQKPAPPAESTSLKSARGAADQRAAWSSARSPLDADPMSQTLSVRDCSRSTRRSRRAPTRRRLRQMRACARRCARRPTRSSRRRRRATRRSCPRTRGSKRTSRASSLRRRRSRPSTSGSLA